MPVKPRAVATGAQQLPGRLDKARHPHKGGSDAQRVVVATVAGAEKEDVRTGLLSKLVAICCSRRRMTTTAALVAAITTLGVMTGPAVAEWSAPAAVATGSTSRGPEACDVTTLSDGTTLATWFSGSPGAPKPFESTDRGLVAELPPGQGSRWSSPRVIWRHHNETRKEGLPRSNGTYGTCPRLVPAPGGRVTVVWAEHDWKLNVNRTVADRLMEVRRVSRGKWGPPRHVKIRGYVSEPQRPLVTPDGHALLALGHESTWPVYATRSPDGKWSQSRWAQKPPWLQKPHREVDFSMGLSDQGRGLLVANDPRHRSGGALLAFDIKRDGSKSRAVEVPRGRCKRLVEGPPAVAISSGPDQRAAVAFECVKGWDSTIFATSRDRDGVWAEPQEVSSGVGQALGISFGPAGDASLAWTECDCRVFSESMNSRIVETSLRAAGNSWSSPVAVVSASSGKYRWQAGGDVDYRFSQWDAHGPAVAVASEFDLASEDDRLFAVIRRADGSWEEPGYFGPFKGASYVSPRWSARNGRGAFLWADVRRQRVYASTASLRP